MSFIKYFIIFVLLNAIINSYHFQNFNMKKGLFEGLSLKDNQLMNESNSYIFKTIKNKEPPCGEGEIINNNNECILPEESTNLDNNKCITTYCSNEQGHTLNCIENGLIPKCICSQNYFGLYCEHHNDSSTKINKVFNDLIEHMSGNFQEIKKFYYYISNFENEIKDDIKKIGNLYEKCSENIIKKIKEEEDSSIFINFAYIDIGYYCTLKRDENKIYTINPEDYLYKYKKNLANLLSNNKFKYSQFYYIINDAYPMISLYFFTNNILSLERMKITAKNNNLTFIDPSNCGSSLLTPTPSLPNSLYVITITSNNFVKLLYNTSTISEVILFEAYLFDSEGKIITQKNIINQCSSLTFYMNPLPLINFTLFSNYSNCTKNGIDIYNINDPAFIDSCFICEGYDYDLPIEYNRNYIFQKYNISSLVKNCSFEGIDQSTKKVKMLCDDLNSINPMAYNITKISNPFKKFDNYSTAFNCYKKVTKIYKNFAFWFYTSLNFVLFCLTIFFIYTNNYESAIRNDNLNKVKLVSSQVIEKNDSKSNNDDDEENNYESKSFGNCFSNNIFQLYPLISIFIPSIIRNQLISLWIFFFSLINIFGFNAYYFDLNMFEKRINDSFRNNFFYPMKREFLRIIYSIITMMIFNFLIRLIVIVSLSKFNQLGNTIKEGNDDAISECKNFECKMLLKRIIAIIIILIIDVFFYYYTIVFCAIYKNTQAGWFYSGIWGFIWNNVFSLIYIIVISIFESFGYEMTSYYMKRLFCF